MDLSIIFFIKLCLVPVLIALINVAGRIWGPGIAGWLSSFPVIAGPILFFIASDQGSDFAVTAATGTLSAVFAVIVFSAAYSWAALKFCWMGSLIVAIFFYALTVLGLTVAHLSLYAALALNFLTILASPRLFPVVAARKVVLKSSGYDLALCMALSAVLVILITFFAQMLGPHLAGVLVMFPILTGSLSVFSHRSAGKEFTIHFLRGTTLGWCAFSMFCFTLAILLQKTTLPSAFFFAILVALAVQMMTRRCLEQQDLRKTAPAALLRLAVRPLSAALRLAGTILRKS